MRYVLFWTLSVPSKKIGFSNYEISMAPNHLSYSTRGYAHRGPLIPDYHSGGFFFGGVRYKSQVRQTLAESANIWFTVHRYRALSMGLC